MKGSAEKISSILASSIKPLGYELWGCELQSRGRRSLLRVYIDDTKGAVTIEDCERVSRQISAILDVEDLIHGSYDLEVSSPGLDRPLFTLEHYQKNIGKKIRIRIYAPQEGKRNFIGILQGVTVEAVTLISAEDNKTWVLPLTDIVKANLEPEFNKVRS